MAALRRATPAAVLDVLGPAEGGGDRVVVTPLGETVLMLHLRSMGDVAD
ncbi:MAG: hypothetical protein H6712_14545 [Myxococcales bacterium]|nr:hypothetical protein [Myxococcales bacterium]MCB9715083.1 hypothetical protein [Myxococcales bacterium]